MSLLFIADSYGGLEDIARGSDEIRHEKENNFHNVSTSTPKSSLKDRKKSKSEQTRLFRHSKNGNIEENKMTGQSSKKINCRFYSRSFKNSLSPSPAVLKSEKTEKVINVGKNLNCRYIHYSRKLLEQISQTKERKSCLKSLENLENAIPISDCRSIVPSNKTEEELKIKSPTNNGCMKPSENKLPVDDGNNAAPNSKSEEDVKSKPKKSYKCPYCFVKSEDSKWMIQHLPDHVEFKKLVDSASQNGEIQGGATTEPKPASVDSAAMSVQPISEETGGSDSVKRQQAEVQNFGESISLEEKSDTTATTTEKAATGPNSSSGRDYKKTKINECIFCSSVFKYQQGLSDHLRTHTEERPYECEICFATFSNRGRLYCHAKSLHKSKMFKCDHCYCSKTFRQRHTLKKHMRTHARK